MQTIKTDCAPRIEAVLESLRDLENWRYSYVMEHQEQISDERVDEPPKHPADEYHADAEEVIADYTTDLLRDMHHDMTSSQATRDDVMPEAAEAARLVMATVADARAVARRRFEDRKRPIGVDAGVAR